MKQFFTIDAREYGFTPEDAAAAGFDAGARANAMFAALAAGGEIVHWAGRYPCKTPILWTGKTVRCDAFVTLDWTGEDRQTIFTFGGRKNASESASDSILSGIKLFGGDKRVTAWKFQNLWGGSFNNLLAGCCARALCLWSDGPGDYNYFAKFFNFKSLYCPAVVCLQGGQHPDIPPESRCAQFQGLDAKGTPERPIAVLFDLRSGACAVRASMTTVHPGSGDVMLVQTEDPTCDANRIELAYLEGGTGHVAWNSSYNRLLYNDARTQIVVDEDHGEDNQCRPC
jgi:hypothetical protein